ncbi:hypothetical protein B0H10DRAFT_2206678 [Mycena sp. CBHHK59/15]|nr:hypothetical protein B0H10DRAFT_2206678 [Mycena sp. CBHHK59/15]
MWLPFPLRGKRRPPPSSGAVKSNSFVVSRHTLPDVLWTSLIALQESADAFPPLKSAVGGVIALWDIAKRAKYSKSDAQDIARRTKTILDVIADAVPDGSNIPPRMLESIERFTMLLDDIQCRMETIVLSSRISHVVHLNKNERALQGIRTQLDEAYRDFRVASSLRLEVHQAYLTVQQTHLAVLQAETHLGVEKVSAATKTLRSDMAKVLFYSRSIVLFV